MENSENEPELTRSVSGISGVTPKLEHNCAITGMRVSALPPGEIDVLFSSDQHLVDINLNPVSHEFALSSDKVKTLTAPKDSVAWYPPEVEFKIKSSNHMWGLLMEIDPNRAQCISPELLDDRELNQPLQHYVPNPKAAMIGRLMIEHLRGSEIDTLYIEGLALATYASCVPVRTRHAISSIGTDQRIYRAIDYIAFGFGGALSVAELAAVANMSPSYFSQCFKSITGEAVWEFVQRFRCEKAYDMLLFSDDPISIIAHQCGFSSQAHLTSAMRSKYGSTPGSIRREHR